MTASGGAAKLILSKKMAASGGAAKLMIYYSSPIWITLMVTVVVGQTTG